jgi:hypothetical protein
MTNQEAFNIAYIGLAKQGFERSIEAGHCQFRTRSGKKCAIGFLIPDEKYQSTWDECGQLGRAIEDCELGIDHAFAGFLQDAHDIGKTPGLMRRELERFAEKYSLTIPEVPNEAK